MMRYTKHMLKWDAALLILAGVLVYIAWPTLTKYAHTVYAAIAAMKVLP